MAKKPSIHNGHYGILTIMANSVPLWHHYGYILPRNWKRGRDVSSPAIWSTKISAHFGDNNVAQMCSRLNGQICSHTPSALNAGAKRSGATFHMAMPQCCYLAKAAKRPSHTTNMVTSSNIPVSWSIWSTHLVDTFVAHVTDAILSPKWLVTKCPWPTESRS